MGDEDCGTLHYEVGRKKYTVLCEKEGREVTLRREGVLTLCEVMVLEVEETPTEDMDEEM